LCGLPGSGKSTWAKKKVKEDSNTIIVNKDKIREMLRGEYVFDEALEYLVKIINNSAICCALNEQHDVIIDETFIKKRKRKEIIEELALACRRNCKIICVYCSSKTGNLDRRMIEPRTYDIKEWERVINNMKKDFEEPTLDEGFNKIIEIKIE
jgi:predicted kinase